MARIGLALCVVLLASASQADTDRQFEPRARLLPRPDWLKLEVEHRTRYEYLDNRFRAGQSGAGEILLLRTRLNARIRVSDWLSLGGEFEDARAYLTDDDTHIRFGFVNTAELLRAYFELSLDGPFGGDQTLQFGRLTMDVGSRRLVARNHFRNNTNAFTGLDWRWQSENGKELRAFYTLPVQRLPIERNRLLENEVEFDSEGFEVQFWGLFFSEALPWGDDGELYLFGLHERDSDHRPTQDRQLFTPGLRLKRSPREGRFDYELELALQAGESRPTILGSVDLDHFAHMHYAALGYTFAKIWSPRLILHYAYASGDDDPTDTRNERFDTLYGGHRFQFGPTSLYGAFIRENINTPGLRLELTPAVRWDAFIDYRAVWLASDRDAWGSTGVWDPSGQSGSFVGSQIEFRVRWEALRGGLELEAGYAHLFAGEFIDTAPNASGGDTNYVYTQVSLGF